MSPAEARRFVTTWKRRFGSAGGPAATARPDRVRGRGTEEPGECSAVTGDGALRPMRDRGAAGSDRLGAVVGPASRVSPRLRPYVEAYFAALRRAGGETDAPESGE